MSTRAQRRKLLLNMGMYFAEIGKVCTPREFNNDRSGLRPTMVNSKVIQKYFGSWTSMVTLVKKEHADLMNFTKPSAVDDAADVMSTPDPLAQLRASTTEK